MVVEHSVTEVVLFCVLIIVCLWCDLHAHQADKPVSARNAAIWSCIWAVSYTHLTLPTKA